MGQPMLPFLAGTAGSQLDSSDSEIEVHHYISMTSLMLSFLCESLKGESVAIVLPLYREAYPVPVAKGLNKSTRQFSWVNWVTPTLK